MEKLRENLRFVVLGALFLITVGIWFTLWQGERTGVLTVSFLDIGQGDSVFIEAPNGTQVLIDSGGGKAVLRALGDGMPLFDRSLDLLIGTHPDQDHIGGFPFVLERYSVANYMDPGMRKKLGSYQDLLGQVNKKHIRYVFARRGQKIILDRGVVLTILHPDREIQGSVTNNASVVAKLTYGHTSFLFSGDAPQNVEEYLVSLDKTYLDVDVLKAGHHGSKTSSGDIFLHTTSPHYVAISAGVHNRYGHPHQETLERIRNAGAIAVGTYARGAITFTSDGQNIGLK